MKKVWQSPLSSRLQFRKEKKNWQVLTELHRSVSSSSGSSGRRWWKAPQQPTADENACMRPREASSSSSSSFSLNFSPFFPLPHRKSWNSSHWKQNKRPFINSISGHSIQEFISDNIYIYTYFCKSN